MIHTIRPMQRHATAFYDVAFLRSDAGIKGDLQPLATIGAFNFYCFLHQFKFRVRV